MLIDQRYKFIFHFQVDWITVKLVVFADRIITNCEKNARCILSEMKISCTVNILILFLLNQMIQKFNCRINIEPFCDNMLRRIEDIDNRGAVDIVK